jgi:hypothetical protein
VTDSTKPGTGIEVGMTLPAELVQQFAQMAMMIPSEGTDAIESIVGAILNAPGWEHLSDPWEAAGAETLAGKTLLITDVTRRPSDYKDGLGIFLVVHYVESRSGERGVWTTGSTACVAQLARAYAGGWLPLYAQIVVAERPTESGYRPHHLKFLGKGEQGTSREFPF